MFINVVIYLLCIQDNDRQTFRPTLDRCFYYITFVNHFYIPIPKFNHFTDYFLVFFFFFIVFDGVNILPSSPDSLYHTQSASMHTQVYLYTYLYKQLLFYLRSLKIPMASKQRHPFHLKSYVYIHLHWFVYLTTPLCLLSPYIHA